MPSRPSRTATLSITATSVVLRRPNTLSTDFPASLQVNVVHVEELHPPVGEKPVVWTLLTSEPIDSLAQIERVIDIYRYRWLIEELFKALKTGCSFEDRMFETRHPLLNLLATSLPIAVELLWMRARVTDEPDAPADEIVTATQLEVLRTMGHRPLSSKPTALEALLAIAGLGGHLKRNGFPGWHVIGRGYQRLLDYEAGWTAARARSAKRNL
jgi:Transposase DDE domain